MSVLRFRLPGASARALAGHWPEYLMEAAGLGLFMVSACLVVIALEHPASPLRQGLEDALTRRALVGLCMGLTAIALIYSPMGKRSGAHLNPAVSFTFWRLGKIDGIDAALYTGAQFLGGAAGVALCAWALPAGWLDDGSVAHVITTPGAAGIPAALLAEMLISFGMMYAVLSVSNIPALNRFTGLLAGGLVMLYITFEAPLSGMSMNPARTLASALAAGRYDALWLYFVGPLVGMLAAAELYVRRHGQSSILCCKLHHDNDQPCIFRCRYPH